MGKKNRTPEENEKHEKKIERILFRFVDITMWGSVIIIGILIYFAPSEADALRPYIRVKSDYTLMFVQSILGIICLNLPGKIEKKWGVKIPSNMLIPFVIFLYCAIFLGEVRSFYYNVPHWDKLLHLFSAGMLGTLGFSTISILNQSDRVPIHLSPLFIAVFAFCFALSLGAIWEIYEYTFDGFLGLNMQKFMTESGTQFVGRAALSDTMDDIITDALGAGVVAIVGYFSMKRYPAWVENMQLRMKQKQPTGQND